MGLFSGLEEFGLEKMKDIKIFEGAEKKASKKEEVVKPQKQESDFLFDKTYTCPVCDHVFTCKTVRAGRIKLVSSDLDLRSKYDCIEPLKYEAVVCEKCGYAALSRFFSNVTTVQEKLVRQQISPNFKWVPMTGDSYSMDDAIRRYKLVLMSTVVKKAKASERAYACLKLAWLYRAKVETLPEDTEKREAVIADLKEQEKECLQHAYEGFYAAFSQEAFPMCGMDEITVTYLVGELARRCGKMEEAGQWISKVILSKTANERVKERARDVKELIVAGVTV